MSKGKMQSLLNSEKTIKNEAKIKSFFSHLAKTDENTGRKGCRWSWQQAGLQQFAAWAEGRE
jgi:hypothetical protein